MPNIKEKPKSTRVRAQDKASLLPQQAGRMLKEKYLRQLDTRPDTEPDGGEYATGEVESGTRRAVDEVTGAIARKPKKERAHTQPSHPSAAAPSGDVPNTERSRPANPQKERSAQPPETAPKERIVTHAVKERTATPHFAQHAASASKPPVETSIGGFAMPERRIALIKERISTARSGIKNRSSLPQPRHTPAPKLKPATVQTTAKRLVRKTRQTAQQHMKRRMVAQAQKAAGRAAVLTKRIAVAVAKTAAAMISSLLGILGGGFLLIALVAVIVIAAVANSPFGLFFAAEKNAPDTVSVAEAVAQVNMVYNATLEGLQAGDYDSIVIHGQAPDWPDVLAVFAVKTAGTASDGLDVATLDADRVDRLTAVFWDMTAIATYVEEIYHSGSGDDDGWTEYIFYQTKHIECKKTGTIMKKRVYNIVYQNERGLCARSIWVTDRRGH